MREEGWKGGWRDRREKIGEGVISKIAGTVM